MPLSGENNNITGFSSFEGMSDSIPAVGNDFIRGTGGFQTFENIFDNGFGVFVARIIGSDNQLIGELCRRPVPWADVWFYRGFRRIRTGRQACFRYKVSHFREYFQSRPACGHNRR